MFHGLKWYFIVQFTKLLILHKAPLFIWEINVQIKWLVLFNVKAMRQIVVLIVIIDHIIVYLLWNESHKCTRSWMVHVIQFSVINDNPNKERAFAVISRIKCCFSNKSCLSNKIIRWIIVIIYKTHLDIEKQIIIVYFYSTLE